MVCAVWSVVFILFLLLHCSVVIVRYQIVEANKKQIEPLQGLKDEVVALEKKIRQVRHHCTMSVMPLTTRKKTQVLTMWDAPDGVMW